MESQLLSIMLRSRDRYFKVYPLLNLKMYSKEFQHLIKIISAYYQRDTSANFVDTAVVIELIIASTSNDKHVAIFKQLVEEALAAEVSDSNVESTVIAAKKRELEQRIALSCVNQDDDAMELMDEYKQLCSMSTLEELLSAGATVIERIDIESVIAERMAGEGSLIKILPLSVNERLDGGVLPGHHITVFARPEMGKSQFVINSGAGVLRQGYKVLHIENEDRPQDVITRYVSNLSGMDRHAIIGDPRRAQRLAETNGLEQLTVVELTPGSLQQVEELASKYEADFIIVNQLRNLSVGEQNRVLALEMAAMGCRNIGKRVGAAVMSVTQAGDSADGKKYLEMGDVDYSNTGIPAACDVLLGIGADDSMLRLHERGISFPKNKVGVGTDSHDGVIVKVRPEVSRVLTAGMNSSQRVD